jgi:hypothetical protein
VQIVRRDVSRETFLFSVFESVVRSLENNARG